MIPSALSGQLQQGLADFLRFSFWSSTVGMEHVIDDLIDEPGGLLKGPYVSLKLPFVSGKNPNFFPNVPMGFTPHFHQEQAFTRLSGRRKQSTLVATGTGSGKTECFLLPILDHCLTDAANKGVKAILIYPMNALATDQAARIAKMIHGNDELRGKVTAGLYIGEDRGKGAVTERKMGPKTVITDRGVMKNNPPNILLTNYKMLDYLLLRPGDQQIWQHNNAGVLRFLVVDEIHTFDGAQGTDLACLIRRLKRRLQVDDGTLCCVGTSATLGGDGAGQVLTDYAEEVFGEPLDNHAVIAESRLTKKAYLAGCTQKHSAEPTEMNIDTLNPANWSDPKEWVQAQASLWFEEPIPGTGNEWAVALGEALKRHTVFHSLLTALKGETVDVAMVVAQIQRSKHAWRDMPQLGILSILSLVGLVSAARSWRVELPEIATQREAEGKPRPVQPFLDVRIQLWQRELRRMVGSLEERPRLRHSMDLDRETRRQHLPLVHCRDCGAMGWATLIQRDKPHLYRVELDRLYRGFFGKDPQVEFLFPTAAIPPKDPNWRRPSFRIDVETMCKLESDETTDSPFISVTPSQSIRSTSKGPELSRDCPFCMARETLSLIGFRAATLTSVYIDQLYASPFNDDKKLLTFSDSVQDAAHRAGFFGSRTWRTNLRIAILQVIQDNDGLTLGNLATSLGVKWKERLDITTWVATFLAPSMTWLHDWDILKEEGSLPDKSNLEDLINRRLAFEVFTEFGMQSGIGRALNRTGSAAVSIDSERLNSAVTSLLAPLQNEVPGLEEITENEVRFFLMGFLFHLRAQGGILGGGLPWAFVETCGKDVHAFKRDHALPAFKQSSRLPVLLTDTPKSSRFATWQSKDPNNWYARWVDRCFGEDKALHADAGSVYPVVMPALVEAGLVQQRIGKNEERIWGVDQEALIVTTHVTALRCATCGHHANIAESDTRAWQGMLCLTARCAGRYTAHESPTSDYFARLYANGDLQRIFTEEHTGLLTRAEREQVEFEFKALPGDPSDPAARKPWHANLLSCTPTLEMGIDIGDLSSTFLCSVPPTQANYLQRIGRAGRQDGNAFVLTVAGGRPHDLYFYDNPAEMFAGEVTPPGVFLDAPAVLERQLTAFCFDRWVAAAGDAADLPKQLRTVFGYLDEEESKNFPYNLLTFVKDQQPILLREFREVFADTITTDTDSHLQKYMVGTQGGEAGIRWKILEALEREKKHRDSLSSKARVIRKEIQRLKELEAKSQDHQEQLDQFDQEKDALLALVGQINRCHTLEFLTGEGLLPNYSFPEAAVSLKSVIWRKKKVTPASGSKYETWSHEYKRSPASALSELAPDASFYAGGRKVKIDQVDVAVSKPEDWRFCAECNHATCINTEDNSTNCPACESEGWADDGQKFRMMRLQQVFATAPDRDSRIRDDRDDREPRFFQRQVMVDISDEDRAGAWHVDSKRMPFGFEYLKNTTFREINFGEPSDQGLATVVAGKETVRPGFCLCAKCGMVQVPKKDPVHARSCPSFKTGAKTVLEECLYLYREFQSEAIRLLLPMTDIGTERQLNSFVAALQLGLKSQFKGSVGHLRTTLYSDPIAGTALRKQYLVIFDTVPGGTGYLKQLITTPTAETRMPLFEVLEHALTQIESCPCWSDPERDGCYRCLYAYRNARDMDDTSALTAADFIRQLLTMESQLKEIGSLGDISVTGLMDSVLEMRFIEALRQIKSPNGKQAKVSCKLVNQKTGYHWTLDGQTWAVEPQVEPDKSETSGVSVSIDFVMKPANATSSRKLAIFLDGWAYHKDRVGKDLRQRQAMIASGNWDVWSFTWHDLDEKFGLYDVESPIDFAIPSPTKLRKMLQQMGLSAHGSIGNESTFSWFEQELLSELGLPWNEISKGVLAATMAPATVLDGERWSEFANEFAPVPVQQNLAQLTPKLFASDDRKTNPHLQFMAVHDGTNLAMLTFLDDSEDLYDIPEYKVAWRGILRMHQLLRHAPGAHFTTTKAHAFSSENPSINHAITNDSAGIWPSFEDIEPDFRPTAQLLMAAGISEPHIGLDLFDLRGDIWIEGELVWDALKVAVTDQKTIDESTSQAAPGWRVWTIEDLTKNLDPLVKLLTQHGEN